MKCPECGKEAENGGYYDRFTDKEGLPVNFHIISSVICREHKEGACAYLHLSNGDTYYFVLGSGEPWLKLREEIEKVLSPKHIGGYRVIQR